ncbi:MAG: cation-translocating P-type ATPase [Candidatus Diapherotrites archaeon]
MGEKWFAVEAGKAVESLGSSEKGLGETEAVARLEKFGANELEKGKKFSAVKLFFGQFSNFLVLILLAAALISFFFGDALDASAIFAIVILNAALGFVQEFKAEKAMEALRKMTALKANVLRGGIAREIDATLLVPGDLVLLGAGDKVPADLRLIESVELRLDEAVLTGESLPVEKNSRVTKQGNAALSEQNNMAFANTIVSFGRGKGVVVETGMRTEFGKIAEKLGEIKEEHTPLQKKLDGLAKKLGLIVLAVSAAVFIVGALEGSQLFEMFMIAVSLGVAAIPEGLPAVITITLALGIQRMVKHNAIVRKMPVVEALGSTTIICSDKTGTLTLNEMAVEKVFAGGELFEVSGKGYKPFGEFFLGGKKINPLEKKDFALLLEAGASCNDASVSDGGKIVGDPTEAALVVAAKKAGLALLKKRVDEIPFSSERKMMTTLHEAGNGKIIAFVKGAPEKILEESAFVQVNGKVARLIEGEREKFLAKAEDFASDAYRVLAIAMKGYSGKDKHSAEKDMVLLGLVALRDPARKEVGEAIALCESAGIRVKIVTGDNALTAKAIAKKIGLNVEGGVVEGKELDRVEGEKFNEIVRNTVVFARVNPEHKFRIVSALKEMGEIVAVTGDGVNDAPALKKADIGIAMGIKGTEVAKEAADMVLRDDNFATIVEAVEEGRKIYDNLKNFVKYLLSANLYEVLFIGALSISTMPLPLLPLQILWINLATDSLPALALGAEKGESDAMQRKPRSPKESLLDGTWLFMASAVAIATLITVMLYFYGMGIDAASGINLRDFSQASYTRTIVFSFFIAFELFLVFSCRGRKTALEMNPFSNKALVAAVAVSFALLFAVIHIPFLQTVFKTVPLTLGEWAIIILLALSSVLVPYLERGLKKIFKLNG